MASLAKNSKQKNLSNAVGLEMFKRDQFTCQNCGQKAPEGVLHVDHIIPIAKGSTNDIMNLATSLAEG